MAADGNAYAKAAWVLRVLGVDVAGPPIPDGQAAGEPRGMDAWLAAREAAVAALRQLEDAFRAMDEPEVPKAIMLLRSVSANLTMRPATRRQVDELRSYIEQESTISEAEMDNRFGFVVSLRRPLLAALSRIQPTD